MLPDAYERQTSDRRRPSMRRWAIWGISDDLPLVAQLDL
jgi:hypothetical protein